MKLSKRMIITISLSLIAIVTTVASVSYAFFGLEKTIPGFGNITNDKGSYTSINSEYELRQNVVDPIDNNGSVTSSSNSRFRLNLTNDIILHDDLVVTRDISLNFNSHYIDLNGFNIKILHNSDAYTTFKNNSLIDDGFINSSETKSIVDLYTEKYQCIGRVLTISDNLDWSLMSANNKEEKLKTIVKDFVDSRMFTEYYNDLFLPFHFYNYDIDFDWVVTNSEDEVYINSFGHILSYPSSSKEISMTLNLSGEITDTLSYTFTLLPQDKETDYYTKRYEIVKSYLDSYFASYKLIEDADIYYIYDSLELPSNFTYFGIESVSYTATSSPKNGGEIATSGDLQDGKVLLIKNSVTNLISRTIELKVKFVTDDHQESSEYIYNFSAINNDSSDEARAVIDSFGIVMLIPQAIKVDGEEVATFAYKLKETSDLLEFGVKSIDYSILYESKDNDGNYVEYYQIVESDGDRYITMNKDENGLFYGSPSIANRIYLNVTFQFLKAKSDEDIYSSKLKIYHKNQETESEGNIGDKFSVAFETLSAQLLNQLDENTYIDMSKVSSNQVDIVMNNSADGKTASYGLLLTSDFKSIYNSDPTNISDLSLNTLTYNGKVIITTSTRNNGQQTVFTVNLKNLPHENLNVTLLYRFTTGYYRQFTNFILPGIINNQQDGIVDINLYNKIVELYDSNDDGVLTTSEAARKLDVAPVISDISISSLEGVCYLDSTDEITFKNINFSNEMLSSLKDFPSLAKLHLNNCGIDNTKIGSIPSISSLTELDLSNDSSLSNKNTFTSFENFSTSATIRILDCSNTELTSIDDITNMPSIETLYLSHTKVDDFRPLLDLNNLKNAYVNDIVGSSSKWGTFDGTKGDYNLSVMTLLALRKVAVYNKYDTTYQLFEPTDDMKEASQVLEGICYSKNGDNAYLPKYLYVSQDSGVSYTINYTSSSYYSLAVNGAYTSEYVVTLTSSAPDEFIIEAYITINGVNYYRPIKVVK